MTVTPGPEGPVAEGTGLRRSGIAGFFAGTAAAFAFFGFFPGLPHVIDWGAIIASLAFGALTRWAWRARTGRKRARLR
ncbi:hypothetical protein OHA37_16880 [Streptomyces sp. NBC_00335]|uniref:hypothetical protein n=1 Tax=unclassified Streptomyces TaxID=2593676 RepID=UPI0022510B41|nr:MULTISPECIES: hypothetical protein [unclassified Streptomyces]MCX5405557.1 hypothetical protein [Streptomyces sp. NBC_00086]